MSENEMMKAKIAPETKLDRNVISLRFARRPSIANGPEPPKTQTQAEDSLHDQRDQE
jgi:hypothetical protein